MTLDKVNTDYTYYINFLSSVHSKVVSEMQVFLNKRVCHWRMLKCHSIDSSFWKRWSLLHEEV